MKNRIMKLLVIGMSLVSIFSASGMLTQDELGAFTEEANKLIASGVSKEELEDYLRNHGYANDIVGGTQALKEAEASGYFNNHSGSNHYCYSSSICHPDSNTKA